MKSLSQKELEMLKKLQQKKRAIDKHEKEFWKEVDARKSEILKHFCVEESKPFSSQNFTY